MNPPARDEPKPNEPVFPAQPQSLTPLAPPDAFLAAAQDMGVAFEAGDVERFGLYLALLLDANTRFNLTRIDDPEQAWEKHILDALTLLPYLAELSGGSRVVDVGSGGGSPGVPIAIAQPSLRVGLIEATGKKARFLEEASRRLGLANVEVFADRAELLAAASPGGPLRERFDAALARALGRLPVALELTLPLIRVGGLALFFKGAQAQAEISAAQEALRLLHGRVVDVRQTLTGRIVAVKKLRPTPQLYPRRPGEPARRPLGSD